MPNPPKFPLLEPMLHTRGEEGFKVGYRFRHLWLLMLYLLNALGKEVLEGERGIDTSTFLTNEEFKLFTTPPTASLENFAYIIELARR